MNRLLLLVAMTATLAACGGGGGGSSSASAPSDTMPSPSGNSFISSVLNLINGSSDTAEPVAVDSFNVTPQDDAEPSPVS